MAAGSSVDPDTTASVDCGTFLAALTARLFRSLASSHQQAFLFLLSKNATGFDHDDAAGLAAERAFDYHLLEKCMLLEAAACVQMNAPSRNSYPRCPSIPPDWKPRCTCSSAEPGILTPAAPTPQLRPAVPQRQLPATPTMRPLSSESTVPMLWRLWRCLKHA